jgi:hypothetical protein
VLANERFKKAVRNTFSVSQARARIDHFLTIFVYPAVNLITIFYLVELFIPTVTIGITTYPIRLLFLIVFTLVGLANFLRKGVRFFRLLEFS